ncbi:hypothetical protein Tco_0782353, partial [Tanacetum coccineum]
FHQYSRTAHSTTSKESIDSHIDDVVVDTYAEWGQKLKGPIVEDPTVQSLLDLQKGSKANTDSDAILYSSYSEESENETDDAGDSDIDLSDDNPDRDDDV